MAINGRRSVGLVRRFMLGDPALLVRLIASGGAEKMNDFAQYKLSVHLGTDNTTIFHQRKGPTEQDFRLPDDRG